MNQRELEVWLVGSSGMLAGEFMRLLEDHPSFVLGGAISRKHGASLRKSHPQLSTETTTVDEERGLASLAQRLKSAPKHSTAIVLGLPHGQSADWWLRAQSSLGELLNQALMVDLSADFRLADAGVYETTYGRAHPAPELLGGFTYGLPELAQSGACEQTTRMAAPGCFATALQLAAVPAAEQGWLDATKPWSFFAVTGSSGSGVEPKPGTHHPHRSGNLWAYGMGGHRHEAELSQALSKTGNFQTSVPLHFMPHSGPFVRGIHLTAALPLSQNIEADQARQCYAARFEGRPFVEVLSEGVPDLRRVVGSNRASIGVHVRADVLNVMVTIDNLIKGGAGQALQCLNLMSGLPETSGLPRAGLGATG